MSNKIGIPVDRVTPFLDKIGQPDFYKLLPLYIIQREECAEMYICMSRAIHREEQEALIYNPVYISVSFIPLYSSLVKGDIYRVEEAMGSLREIVRKVPSEGMGLEIDFTENDEQGFHAEVYLVSEDRATKDVQNIYEADQPNTNRLPSLPPEYDGEMEVYYGNDECVRALLSGEIYITFEMFSPGDGMELATMVKTLNKKAYYPVLDDKGDYNFMGAEIRRSNVEQEKKEEVKEETNNTVETKGEKSMPNAQEDKSDTGKKEDTSEKDNKVKVDKKPPNQSATTAPPLCIACGDTKKNSKGGPCQACAFPGNGNTPSEVKKKKSKPRRPMRRRTPEEIEADRLKEATDFLKERGYYVDKKPNNPDIGETLRIVIDKLNEVHDKVDSMDSPEYHLKRLEVHLTSENGDE